MAQYPFACFQLVYIGTVLNYWVLIFLHIFPFETCRHQDGMSCEAPPPNAKSVLLEAIVLGEELKNRASPDSSSVLQEVLH